MHLFKKRPKEPLVFETDYQKYLTGYADKNPPRNFQLSQNIAVSPMRCHHTLLLGNHDYILPSIQANVCRGQHNYVIYDKGAELYESTHKTLETLGYKVYLIDAFFCHGPSVPHEYNPFTYLHTADDAEALANVLIEAISPFFEDDAGTALIRKSKSCIWLILECVRRLPKTQQHMQMVFSVLQDIDVSGWRHSQYAEVFRQINPMIYQQILDDQTVEQREWMTAIYPGLQFILPMGLRGTENAFTWNELNNGKTAIFIHLPAYWNGMVPEAHQIDMLLWQLSQHHMNTPVLCWIPDCSLPSKQILNNCTQNNIHCFTWVQELLRKSPDYKQAWTDTKSLYDTIVFFGSRNWELLDLLAQNAILQKRYDKYLSYLMRIRRKPHIIYEYKILHEYLMCIDYRYCLVIVKKLPPFIDESLCSDSMAMS